MDEPPVDPQDWSDEQWISWLESTEDETEDEPAERASRADRLRSSSMVTGLGGAMMAVQEIFYGPREDKIEAVADAGGDPGELEPLVLHLDADHPEESTATVRPWLRKSDEAGAT